MLEANRFLSVGGAIVDDHVIDPRRIAQKILDSRYDVLFLVKGGVDGQYLQFFSHGIVDFQWHSV